ncbi:SAF domain-containing protein [Salana multivorans]
MTLLTDDHAPAAPAPPRAATASPPSPRTARRRPTRRQAGLVGLSLALIATGGGTGAWLLTRSTQYLDVLVVAAPVARGERIEAADLTTTSLPADTINISPVQAADLTTVVGQLATSDLAPGSLLTPAQIASELTPTAGTSLVGLPWVWRNAPPTTCRPGNGSAWSRHPRQVASHRPESPSGSPPSWSPSGRRRPARSW